MSPTQTLSNPATASAADTCRVLASAVAPILAQGVIARRPAVVGLAGRLGADRRGVQVLHDLRERYGTGPVRLRVPGRPVAVVLGADDVRTVLSGPPFEPDTWEKRGALGHFQPHGVLVSRGELREQRRRFVEEVLDADRPVHRFGARIAAVAQDEAAPARCTRSTPRPSRPPSTRSACGSSPEQPERRPRVDGMSRPCGPVPPVSPTGRPSARGRGSRCRRRRSRARPARP